MWQPNARTRAALGQATRLHGYSAYETGELTQTDIADAFADEGQAILNELRSELADAFDLHAIPTFELDRSDWLLGGRAEIAAPDGPKLTLSLGLVIALDEALHALLSWASSFAPLCAALEPDDGGYADPHQIERGQLTARIRFLDYRPQLGRREQTAGEPPIEMPSAMWRLRQHDLLFRLSVRWAALHEFAHLHLGHLHLLRRCAPEATSGHRLSELAGFAAQGNGETGVPDELWNLVDSADGIRPPDIFELHKVLELHADTFAMRLAFDLHGAASRRLFDGYARDMGALAPDDGPVLQELGPNDRFRAMLLAALVCVTLFENGRARRGINRFLYHPLPDARLINLMDGALYGCPLAVRDANGEARLNINEADFFPESSVSDWNRFMFEGLVAALTDISHLTDDLHIDAGFNLGSESLTNLPIAFDQHGYPLSRSADDLTDASPGWWCDLQSLLRARARSTASKISPASLMSDGGREIAALSIWGGVVREMCEQVAGKGEIGLWSPDGLRS